MKKKDENKKRKAKYIALAVRVIVICLTIVYDPLTKNLVLKQSKHNIKWDIHFANL